MGKWIDQVKGLDEQSTYEKKRVELTAEEMNEIMPKVDAFYNAKPEDRKQPIFTHKGGVFAIIRTPDATYDDPDTKKNLKQKFEVGKYPDYSTKEDTYSLNGTKILYDGVWEYTNFYTTISGWKRVCDVTKTGKIPVIEFLGKKAYIFGDLSVKYQSQIEVEDPKTKAMKKPPSKPLAAFLKSIGAASLEDVEEAEYKVYYTLKIWQIVE